jgi:hypothetical protein
MRLNANGIIEVEGVLPVYRNGGKVAKVFSILCMHSLGRSPKEIR